MKNSLFMIFVSMVVCSVQALTVGKKETFDSTLPTDWTVENSETKNGTLSVSSNASTPAGIALDAKNVAVLTLDMAFSIPSAEPDYATLMENKKLVLTANTEGTVLVSDASIPGFKSTNVKIVNGVLTNVQISAYLEGDAQKYDVSVGNGTPITVQGANSSAVIATLGFAGEGSVDNILMTQVATSILPEDSSGRQNVTQVKKYGEWKNSFFADSEKPENSGNLQDAFLLNVSPANKPSLAITDINAEDSGIVKITLKGEAGVDTVNLKNINGILTLHGKNVLNETAKKHKVNVLASVAKPVVIAIPTDERFVKASVEFTDISDNLEVSAE